MAKGKIALELTDVGIYDLIRNQNSNWNNIIDMKRVEYIKGQESFRIAFILADKEVFIKKRFFFLRPFYRISSILFSTPFLISLNFLDGRNDEILQQVEDYYRQIKISLLKK